MRNNYTKSALAHDGVSLRCCTIHRCTVRRQSPRKDAAIAPSQIGCKSLSRSTPRRCGTACECAGNYSDDTGRGRACACLSASILSMAAAVCLSASSTIGYGSLTCRGEHSWLVRQVWAHRPSLRLKPQSGRCGAALRSIDLADLCVEARVEEHRAVAVCLWTGRSGIEHSLHCKARRVDALLWRLERQVGHIRRRHACRTPRTERHGGDRLVQEGEGSQGARAAGGRGEPGGQGAGGPG